MKLNYKRFLLLFLTSIQVGFAQSDFEKKESEMINFQKDIVAQLTGHSPIKGNKKLKSRASVSERKTTGDYLFSKLKSYELKPKRHTYDVQDSKGTRYTGTNIYTEISATNDSKEYIVLGAHFDTKENSPGAVHNATGVALAQFIASKLKKLEVRNRNFIIVFFDQQENNMIGCRMFAKKLQESKYKIHSMHRVDYMGWDNDEDRAIELLTSNIGLESLYRGESPVPVYKRTVATPESRVFSTLGYETITITAELKNSDSSPFVHQSSDTYTTINFKYLASTTDIVFKVMKSLAK